MGNWQDIVHALESNDIKDEVVTLTLIAGISAQIDLIRTKDSEIMQSLAKAIIPLCNHPSAVVRQAAKECIAYHFTQEFKDLQHKVEKKIKRKLGKKS